MSGRADIAVGGWIADHADAARAMWDEGVPASEIARRVGCGATKSSIVGYGHRHGWPPRPSPIPVNGIRPAAAAPRKPPGPHKAPAAPKAPKAPRQPHRASTPAPTPPPPPAAVRTCQWIPEDCNERPWRFCGEPTLPGSPYCPSHHARAYHRNPRMAEAA